MLSNENARYVLEKIIELYPEVETELNHRNDFELLIAVILSAQATDRGVNGISKQLFEDYPTPQAMAQADPKDLEPYIEPIGLYKNKSKYIQACAQALVDKFDGQVPANRKDLESLPGVGRKTASVVLSIAFDVPAFAVDTHVTRVCKRHRIVAQNANVRQIEDRVTSLLPPEQWKQAHQALVRFGRYICTARKPTCDQHPQLWTLPNPKQEKQLQGQHD
ncbi:endonuclease III [Hutsoniella sourekii]